MKPTPRPADSAPGGMGGARRMYDPSEAAHDRVRRRLMNTAFVLIALLNAAQLRWIGVHGWQWLEVLFIAIGAAPLGVGVRVFELRFKMAAAERTRILCELPAVRKFEWLIYAVLVSLLLMTGARFATWALVGIWLNDFVMYYHDRPERMRHLYAVAKTIDELREFRAPWAWPLPAIIIVGWRVCFS